MATSGNLLFDRRCRLTIATPVADKSDFHQVTSDVIEIDGGVSEQRDDAGMRVQFKINKSTKKEPNTSEITVTNLSGSRRASLQQKDVKLLLEAGYKEMGVNRYFSGDVRTVDHVRQKADWETLLKLGDGERAWKYARVYASFSVGTRAEDVLKTLARGMGLKLGNVDKQASSLTSVLDQGYAVAGNAARGLDQFVKSLRKTWSVQDDELQILDPYETLDLPIPDITPDTGLIGSPEMGSPPTKGKPQLVKFQSLLIPVKPGSKVKLKSSRYDGYVRVQACSFEGDTHGGPWYTTISGVLLR